LEYLKCILPSTTEIAQLEADIKEDQEAIATATAIREKEHAAFVAEEADLKESTGALAEAVKVLQQVQVVQQKGNTEPVVKAALLQVRNIIQRHSPTFHSVMQKDLWDVLSSLESLVPASTKLRTGLARKTAPTAFQQSKDEPDVGRQLLPWQKSDEQLGMEAKPNDLVGYAAGAKSYNSRSGQILGVLMEMGREFSRDLGVAQKAEIEAEIAFQKLNAAKLAEIAAAMAMKKAKEAELADLLAKTAQAREDKEILEECVKRDKEFLLDLEERCKVEAEEYEKRVKVRSQEIVALSETLKILTADDARDLYAKTIPSLLQVGAVTHAKASEVVQARDRMQEHAMRKIAEVARKHKNWALAALAVRVNLDPFTKVKEVMDKMLAELRKQQKEEYAKVELCKKSIDKTEDDIKVELQEKKDLSDKHTMLTNTLETLKSDIVTLKAQISDSEVSLKEAGEVRKKENDIFQTSVADQRATINILNKALARLKQFYFPAKAKSFMQRRDTPIGEQGGRPEDLLRKAGWGGASKPPPAPADYKKSGLSGGVIQLISMIIGDAEAVEGELVVSEQRAQEDYAAFARDTEASILGDRAAVADKEKQVATTKAAISVTEQAQLVNEADLETLGKLLKEHHLACDYVLKYFDIRQTARQEEINAILDAKAILSGADFGQ